MLRRSLRWLAAPVRLAKASVRATRYGRGRAKLIKQLEWVEQKTALAMRRAGQHARPVRRARMQTKLARIQGRVDRLTYAHNSAARRAWHLKMRAAGVANRGLGVGLLTLAGGSLAHGTYKNLRRATA